MRTFSRSELRFLLALTVLTICIAAFPTVYAIVRTPESMVYSGRHLQNTGDYAVYFSQMEQARQGHLCFKNLYTSESHDADICNPVWYVLGTASRVAHVSVPIMFHLARLAFIPLFIYVLARLIWMVYTDGRLRRLAMVLAVFAGGVVGYAKSTDGSAFHALLFSPHLILSMIGIISIFLFVWKSIQTGKKSYALFAGGCAFLLFLFHPYHISSVFGIYILVWVISGITRMSNMKRFLTPMFILIMCSLPAIGYHWWFFSTSPIGPLWLEQSNVHMHTWMPWQIGIAFAPLYLFAGIGLVRWYRMSHLWFPLLCSWSIAPLILMAVPWFFRMRMSGALSIGLSILAAEGLLAALPVLRRAYGTVASHALIVVFAIGVFSVSLTTWAYSVTAYAASVPLAYIPNDMVTMMSWYKNNASETDVLLSSWYTGNVIPAFTGRTVYGGHGVQTLHAQEKFDQINRFFGNMDESSQRQFFRDHGITYILYSPFERQIGSRLPSVQYLEEVFHEGECTIFRVKQ
ncbi:MAG: hypothetical protein WC289_01375 [Patescibacteria group bacterium]|jgi:hypothetical protein